MEVYPDGPQMKDDQGMLPVHLACRNGASKGVVLTLLSAFPESIHVRDRKGRSPTDLVFNSSSANKEAVLVALKKFIREVPVSPSNVNMEVLYKAAASKKTRHSSGGADRNAHIPGSPVTKEVDYENRTVLFRLILKKEWKAASARAISHPEEALTWIVTKGFNGNLRFLPLHKACVLQPPEQLIEDLLQSYSAAAVQMDQDGWLPLHCACFYGANEKVVSTLLSAYSKGAQSKDDEGRLPLHYACLKGASQGCVDALLASFPKGAMSKDDEGRLPIHHACGKGAPEGVVDALLKASPKGAQSKDDQGRIPLHHACRKNASERVIRTLIKVYPRAAQIKDDQDKLPIHYACQHQASHQVVSILLQTYPESVNVQNGFGYTPLAEAKSQDSPQMEYVVKILEKVKKEQDKKKIDSGEYTIYDSKIASLEDKVHSLEKTLSRVAALGKEMKSDLTRKNKNSSEVLEKFADSLIEIGAKAGGSGSKTPLKSRQSTPVKGLFGLGSRSKSVSKVN